MTIIPPEVTSAYEDHAQSIRSNLLQLVQSIRGFTLLTTERRRKINVSGHVDEDFLRSMALLIEATPTIAAACDITAAEIRDHLQFSGSYQGVGEELILNGRKMADTVLAERADVGERTLRALKMARSINFPAGKDSLVPHLEAIEHEFVRGRRRRRKPQTDETKPSTGPAKPEVKP
jgi:hypothetical protein